LISASTVSFELAQQTGEQKTTLTDANQKNKENNFNRCQSEKKRKQLSEKLIYTNKNLYSERVLFTIMENILIEKLDKEKRARFQAAFKNKKIEVPIVIKFKNDDSIFDNLINNNQTYWVSDTETAETFFSSKYWSNSSGLSPKLVSSIGSVDNIYGGTYNVYSLHAE
jgi:hypothetical protein